MKDTRFKKGMVPWNKKEHIVKLCPTCNKEFHVKPSLDRVTYCSRSCKQKGKPSNMKGKKHTVEAKRKMSLAKFGFRGSQHWNWKGGSSRLERALFRDRLQKKVFERDNYTCQICGQGGDLQVDHIQSWAEYIELRFNINNCRTLCVRCHYKITFGKPMPPKVRAWGHNFLKGGT